MSPVTNFVAFQAGWLACVLGGAHGAWMLGAAIAVAIVAWHLAHAPRPLLELGLIGAIAPLGYLWDSLLVAGGWFVYPHGSLVAGWAPAWILAMWLLFPITLNASLRWLKQRAWLAAAFGVVGGPLAYYAGVRLGAVSLPDPASALALQAVGWAVLMPAFVLLARRLDGLRPLHAEAARS
ncbi:MAG: DUF2878 domain-containing protein [Gammaproteobacteria bacterium]